MRGETTIAYRGGERFAYCSTFKWVLAAAVLQKVDLSRSVHFTKRELTAYSPTTAQHLDSGMTVGELCAAAVEKSDNTAANLLEPLVGGPAGLRSFVRALGDTVMRFDRPEPFLNDNTPGDPRDTTSPDAMARLLRTVLSTPRLRPAQLVTWMKATTTGEARIRAAVPRGFAVGDKTGTGDHGATNDVAVIFPPEGDPIYLVVFTDGDGASRKTHERAIVEATRIVLAALKVPARNL